MIIKENDFYHCNTFIPLIKTHRRYHNNSIVILRNIPANPFELYKKFLVHMPILNESTNSCYHV